MEATGMPIHRRELLRQLSGLVIGFSLSGVAPGPVVHAAESGDYGPPVDQIDSWIAISADGHATLFSGCCELGTGSSTGLLQVMAEELDIAFDRVRLICRTPIAHPISSSHRAAARFRLIRGRSGSRPRKRARRCSTSPRSVLALLQSSWEQRTVLCFAWMRRARK